MIDESIDIRPDQAAIIRNILRIYAPKEAKFWAFGSRVKWTAKHSSDLDLAMDAGRPLKLSELALIKEQLDDSSLPWKVDLVDVQSVTPEFKQVIERDRVPFFEHRQESAEQDWTECKLGDVIELKRGYDLPAADRKDGSFPIVSSGGITGFHSHAMAKAPGVVTGRYGTIGNLFYLKQDYWPLNTALYVRDFKGNDPKFIYYFLKTLDWNRFNDKSGVPGVNRNHVHDAIVRIPSCPHQKAIAEVLSSLDDKIELNRRMNETLEAITQAIFKDWFVDFGPTRAKMEGRAPYLAPEIWSLFPDRLDDEGKPEAWRYSEVSEIGEVVCGKTPSTAVKDYYGNDIPFITIPDMHGKIFVLEASKKLSKAGALSQAKKTLPTGSICVSCIATPGLVVITHEPAQTNQQINSVVPREPRATYYWYWIMRGLGEEIKQGGSGGSVLSNLNTGRFMDLKVLFASDAMRTRFQETVAPIFDCVLNNEYETKTLAFTRDFLLPKLMSGEIRIKDAEKIAEGAA